MKLSQNFTLEELCVSDTAERMGKPIVASKQIIDELRRGCKTVVQPIRNWHGNPLIINSGYRPEWLNKAIGGSRTSQHMKGQAVDFRILRAHGKLIVLARAIARSDIPFDQLIYECDSWIHVSWPALGVAPRQEVLTMYRKPGLIAGRPKTTYVSGIHEIATLLSEGT